MRDKYQIDFEENSEFADYEKENLCEVIFDMSLNSEKKRTIRNNRFMYIIHEKKEPYINGGKIKQIFNITKIYLGKKRGAYKEARKTDISAIIENEIKIDRGSRFGRWY